MKVLALHTRRSTTCMNQDKIQDVLAARHHGRAVLGRPRSVRPPPRASRRRPAAPQPRDSAISPVLTIHAQADRPLGFDQVVELCGNRGAPRPGECGQRRAVVIVHRAAS